MEPNISNVNNQRTDLSDMLHIQKIGHKRLVIDRNKILETIKQKAPLSISELKRELNIGYGTLWQILREFEFCKLIVLTPQKDAKNNESRVISLLELNYEEGKNELRS